MLVSNRLILYFQRKANYGFRLPDPLACKHLWKCAVEHLAFYRWRIIKVLSILTAINQSINQSINQELNYSVLFSSQPLAPANNWEHCTPLLHLLNAACVNVTVMQNDRYLHAKLVLSRYEKEYCKLLSLASKREHVTPKHALTGCQTWHDWSANI